jgi:antitoxin CcdA
MTNRATFTLDEEAYAFLRTFGGKNKSAFINNLLKKERQSYLQKSILSANLEEAGDATYQQELAEWDVTALDGIDQ